MSTAVCPWTWTDLIGRVRDTIMDPTEVSRDDDYIMRALESALVDVLGRLDWKSLPLTVREAARELSASPPAVALPQDLVQLVTVRLRWSTSDPYRPAFNLERHRQRLVEINPRLQGDAENPVAWMRGNFLYLSPRLSDVSSVASVPDGVLIEYVSQPELPIVDRGERPPVTGEVALAMIEYAAAVVAGQDRDEGRHGWHRARYDGHLLTAVATAERGGRMDTGPLAALVAAQARE